MKIKTITWGMMMMMGSCLVAWAADKPVQDNPGPSPIVQDVRDGKVHLATVFHIGKSWSKELAPFPTNDNRFLVVELTVENRGSSPISLYFDQVWLHMDEENQKLAATHAEEIGPKIYISLDQPLPDDPGDGPAKVTVYNPNPGYRNGEIRASNNGVSGVVVDLSKGQPLGGSPVSKERFVMALFKKEFNTTFLKQGQNTTGLFYFYLPWNVISPQGLQLHLTDFFGEPGDIEIASPALPVSQPK